MSKNELLLKIKELLVFLYDLGIDSKITISKNNSIINKKNDRL